MRDPLIQRLMTLLGADMPVASGVAAAIRCPAKAGGASRPEPERQAIWRRAGLPANHAKRGSAYDYNIMSKRAEERQRIEAAEAIYAFTEHWRRGLKPKSVENPMICTQGVFDNIRMPVDIVRDVACGDVAGVAFRRIVARARPLGQVLDIRLAQLVYGGADDPEWRDRPDLHEPVEPDEAAALAARAAPVRAACGGAASEDQQSFRFIPELDTPRSILISPAPAPKRLAVPPLTDSPRT